MSIKDKENNRNHKSFVNNMVDKESASEKAVKVRVTTKKVEKKDEQDPLIQRAYYINKSLNRAITLKTVDSEMDKSEVVRQALKMYLAEYL